MQRWMALYRDGDGNPKQAIIMAADNEMPFGMLASDIVSNLPDYNSGGGCFLIAMPETGDTPLVVDVDQDMEVAKLTVMT